MMMTMIIIIKTVCAISPILFKYFKEHNGMQTIKFIFHSNKQSSHLIVLSIPPLFRIACASVEPYRMSFSIRCSYIPSYQPFIIAASTS